MAGSGEPIRAWARQLEAADRVDRLAAATALAQAGEEARPAAVLLARATADEDSDVTALASEALENLGAPDVSDLPLLIQLLAHQHPDCVYWGATLIGRLGSQGTPAVLALASLVDSSAELYVRERVVWALGRIGCAAEGVRQVLQAAARSDAPRLARLAREALTLIG